MDSQWEDCSFRIDTLNIILFTAEGLQEGVKSVQKMIEVDAYDVDAVKSLIGEVLDMLSENLDQMLPPVPEHGFTRYIYTVAITAAVLNLRAVHVVSGLLT